MTALNELTLSKKEHGDGTQECGLQHPAAGISETSWQIILLTLSAAVVLFSVYCLSHGITIIFMHLYYLPIVLLAYRYRYRGFVLSVILSLAYIVLVLFYSMGQNEVIIGALIRFVVFIGIAAVVAYLSEQFIQSGKSLKKLADIQESSLMNAHVWLVLLDRRGSVLLWNNAAERISGYSAAEVTGSHTIWKLLYPDKGYRAVITKKIERIIAEDQFFENLETTIRTKSGDEKVISWNTRSFPIISGQEARSIAIGIDISERKVAEKQLLIKSEELAATGEELQAQFDALAESERTIRLSEERLIMAQEIGHTGCWEYDLVTDKIWGSAEGLRLFGFPSVAGAFPIDDIEACIPERERVHAALIDLINAGKEYNLEYTINPRDGSAPKVISSIARLEKDAQGNPIRIIGIIRDITERKRAEDALLRVNQKLNVISQLTRKDLTNQIFVLNSYLELTKNQLTGQDRVIETVQKGIRAIQSIHETIEYSKDYQDMGAKPPAWQNVNMALLFGLSHISIGNIQHSLETENLEIFADPLLEKVCQRLFENSVKHGDHVSRIRVSHTVTPEGVTIFFEDDGIGISAEQKEQIFLRSDGTRVSMRSLIFVREILDITGITIRETGESGKGARFEMTVPKGAYRLT